MIPQDTLNIIEQEANKLYPINDQRRDVFSSDNKQYKRQLSYIAGAKRGYELAMGECISKEHLDKITIKHLNERAYLQEEISRLKKENEELKEHLGDMKGFFVDGNSPL